MQMSPGIRKLMLTVHVTASVGWIGAIAAYIALNVPTYVSDDEQTVRAAYLMMEPVLRYALIPLAAVALITGIVQALGTPWGLVRHYWVTISLALTAFAFVVLVLHLPAVEAMSAVAAEPTGDVDQLGGDLFHAVGGLVVLLVPLVLNIYKPRGMTRYGWRRAQDRRTTSPHT
ncbi:hypothetical protein APR04_005718 [Promicromonospora umidemergens]|uniref:DUF2269 domain-containing protein n=1 Tax=Promicromonospora umidemergens TaxID=629679 RepID=A0ABP8Y3P2_9MICO|nr:DUF2269 domain-containing protein [Promicromonospora umidemergens]MCP2286778.1 hypothetical protein [Promicromonospora umidemergens]